jgi:hypothetical protein
LIAALITGCGYALNMWAGSLDRREGDLLPFIVGGVSIAPLYPLALIYYVFDWRWEMGDFGSYSIFQLFCLALIPNAFLLGALGFVIGKTGRFLRKRNKTHEL